LSDLSDLYGEIGDLTMLVKIETKVDERLAKIAEQLIGWYFDTRGVLCCMWNNKLFTIFVNSTDDTIDICVDELSNRGYFENNIVWETLDLNNNVNQQVAQIMLERR